MLNNKLGIDIDNSVKKNTVNYKDIVVKMGKQNYFFCTTVIYHTNKDMVLKLMKKCKAFVQHSENIESGYQVTWMVPVSSIKHMEGKFPFYFWDEGAKE